MECNIKYLKFNINFYNIWHDINKKSGIRTSKAVLSAVYKQYYYSVVAHRDMEQCASPF